MKEVDAEENTIRFWQEIYNNKGTLIEIHEKFPSNEGHVAITKGQIYDNQKRNHTEN
jgi:hypothetical protein